MCVCVCVRAYACVCDNKWVFIEEAHLEDVCGKQKEREREREGVVGERECAREDFRLFRMPICCGYIFPVGCTYITTETPHLSLSLRCSCSLYPSASPSLTFEEVPTFASKGERNCFVFRGWTMSTERGYGPPSFIRDICKVDSLDVFFWGRSCKSSSLFLHLFVVAIIGRLGNSVHLER